MDDNFPAGIRVLAVDHDSTCLVILETMLRQCQYNVTPIKRASKALDILRQNNNNFDLVMCDIVHMPADKPDDVDGFQLLRKVSLEMDIPVVIMSPVDDKKVIMKCISDGACDYLIKPLRIEEIKNIWQHVFRRKIRFGCKVQLGKNKCTEGEYMISSTCSEINIGAVNKKKKRKEDDDEEEETATPHKKRRVIWTPELHQKFLAAVNQLGIDKAVPKRILELMNVDNITRENVASHLQKHRMNLKKLASIMGGANYNSTSGSAYVDNTVQMTPPAAQHMQPAAAGYINIPYADQIISSSGLIIPQSQWGTQAQPAADYNLHVHGILSMQEQNDTTTDYIAPHPLAAAHFDGLDNINCAMPMPMSMPMPRRGVCSKQGHMDSSSSKCNRYIQFPNFCHNTAAQAPTPAPTHSYLEGPIQIQHMNIHQQELSSQSFNHDGSYLDDQRLEDNS